MPVEVVTKVSLYFSSPKPSHLVKLLIKDLFNIFFSEMKVKRNQESGPSNRNSERASLYNTELFFPISLPGSLPVTVFLLTISPYLYPLCFYVSAYLGTRPHPIQWLLLIPYGLMGLGVLLRVLEWAVCSWDGLELQRQEWGVAVSRAWVWSIIQIGKAREFTSTPDYPKVWIWLGYNIWHLKKCLFFFNLDAKWLFNVSVKIL